jgi:hypothetical protein
MRAFSSVKHCLPPLAEAFSFSSRDVEFSARIDAVVAAGGHAVSVVFTHIRKALAEGRGETDNLEMEILAGLVGTGVTLLEALLVISEGKNIGSVKQAELRVLLKEYKNLYEDIEMFSTDISADECCRAAFAGKAFSGLNTPEEDAAWRAL